MMTLLKVLLIWLIIHVNGDCGIKKVKVKPYISNGAPTEPGDWPWHVAIYHRYGKDIKYKCGGTILSTTIVITAAHCLFEGSGKLVKNRLAIHAGRYTLSEFEDYSRDRKVDEVIVHEGFDVFSLIDDIALLKLATELVYSNYIQAACLSENNEDIVGQRGTVVGWGLNEDDELSDVLTQATMPVVSNDDCLKYSPEFEDNLSDEAFCAGDRNGTSVCSGDSGGGMFFEVNGVWTIRGIVSFGGKKNIGSKQVCSHKSRVIFTDVAKYLNWIKDHSNIKSTSNSDEKLEPDEIKNRMALLNPSNCGLSGQDKSLTHFPWLARIIALKRTRDGGQSSFVASVGTLISLRYIVTSAWYYFFNTNDVKKEGGKIIQWYARLGGFDVENLEKCSKSSFKCPFEQDIDIERIINHPKYDHESRLNDISLYRLETPVDLNKFEKITPICIPINEQFNNQLEPIPKSLITVGWNEVVNSVGSWITDFPVRKVEVVDCAGNYYYKRFHAFTTAFCVSKENCSYLDYGVPLQGLQEINGTSKYFLYGIKIEGLSSCDGPDVFFDILKYINWIIKNIMP